MNSPPFDLYLKIIYACPSLNKRGEMFEYSKGKIRRGEFMRVKSASFCLFDTNNR